MHEPSLQPPSTMLLHILDIALKNMRNWAILDSSVSIVIYLALRTPVRNKKWQVNGNQVHSSYTGNLNMSHLLKAAMFYNIIAGLVKDSLISVMWLYKTGYKL